MSASNHQLAIDVLNKLGKGALASKVQSVGKRVFDDTKLTDHHAVIPLAPLPAGVTDKERKVYNLVYRKFVGAFMDPHDYEATTVTTTCGRYDFQSKGKRELNLGWRELYTTDKQNADDQALPALTKRIRSRRDVFKVAARPRLLDFEYHSARCREQHVNRETLRRVEKRAIDGSSAVSNAQDLHMNTGT
jgi:DNA topoisomerase IA